MWRAMASLLVLRDQVNVYAPNRSRASDGLVGDTAHQGTNSDHNPHYVPGVGSEIVTALDLTHDPAHGFDSYRFAEVLRQHRDPRIKYVISNRRLFSSYATGSRAAWAWGPYTGIDPHTNHVHVSVLDAPISDTRTAWNLEGLDMPLAGADKAFIVNAVLAALGQQTPYLSAGVGKAAAAAGYGPVSARALLEYQFEQTVLKLPGRLDAILAAASDDPTTSVTMTPEDRAALVAQLVAALQVPSPAEVADAVADEQAARLAS
jgi:hypothetical protein